MAFLKKFFQDIVKQGLRLSSCLLLVLILANIDNHVCVLKTLTGMLCKKIFPMECVKIGCLPYCSMFLYD